MPQYKTILHRMRPTKRISKTDLKRSTRALETPKQSRSLSHLRETLLFKGGGVCTIQRSAKKPATMSTALLFPTSRSCPCIPEALNFCRFCNVICLEDTPLQLFLRTFSLKYIALKLGYNSTLLEASATNVSSSKR